MQKKYVLRKFWVIFALFSMIFIGLISSSIFSTDNLTLEENIPIKDPNDDINTELLDILLPESSIIDYDIFGVPADQNWTLGCDIDDIFAYNFDAYIEEYNSTVDEKMAQRLNRSYFTHDSDLGSSGQDVLNLTYYRQTGPLNPNSVDLVDDPLNDTSSVSVNFTHQYISFTDYRTLVPWTVPMDVNASMYENMDWVAKALLNDTEGVENYHNFYMNNYTIVGNNQTIAFKNTTNSDFINLTYDNNGILTNASLNVNFSQVGLIAPFTMYVNISTMSNYSEYLAMNTTVHVSEGDLIYYEDAAYGDGPRNYLRINVTDIYKEYQVTNIGLWDSSTPFWIINGTGEFANFTHWDPYMKNETEAWGEVTLGAFNRDENIVVGTFDMMNFIFSENTDKEMAEEQLADIYPASIVQYNDTLTVESSIPPYLEVVWNNASTESYINLTISTDVGIMDKFSLEIYIPGQGLPNDKMEREFNRISWPLDFYNNDLIVMPGETLLYNMTDRILTPDPKEIYQKIEITNIMNYTHYQSLMGLDLVGGTVIAADMLRNDTSDWENDSYSVYGGREDMNMSYFANNQLVFSYSFLWNNFTNYIYPINTTGEDLYDFCWFFRLLLNSSKDEVIIGDYNISIVNTQRDEWVNISVTPEGILEHMSVNFTFAFDSTIMFLNYTMDLIEYDAIPRGFITVNSDNGYYNCSTFSFDSNRNIPLSNMQSFATTWDYGDGSPEELTQIGNHRYNESGYYTVRVKIEDGNGDYIYVEKGILVEYSDVITQFTVPDGLYTGENMLLNPDISVIGGYSIDTTEWNYGDSGTSTSLMGSHNYTQPGIYTISLTINMTNGDTYITTRNITILNSSLVLDFTLPSQIYTYEQLSATSSVGVIGGYTTDSYEWDFGDGGTATGSTGIHSYTLPGNYTITLMVNSTNGDKFWFSKNITIDASSLILDFYLPNQLYHLEELNSPSEITIIGNYTVETIEWVFGDGITSTGEVGTHTYLLSGDYNITLTVNSTTGETYNLTKLITVDQSNVLLDISAPSKLIDGVELSFYAEITIIGAYEIESAKWDFDDGLTATGEVGIHTFATPGEYIITVTVTTTNGETFTASVTVVVEEAPLEMTILYSIFGAAALAAAVVSSKITKKKTTKKVEALYATASDEV